MGYPELISTLPRHEIGKIRELSLKESGIGGPVIKVLVDCRTYILAAVMP